MSSFLRATVSALPIVGLLALAGCSPAVASGGGYCAPPASAASFALPVGAPLADGAPRDAHLSALLGLPAKSADAATPESRARTVERIQLAMLAIEATAAELDCESERAAQAADYLTRGQSKTAQALTISSVIAAALTGIAGVLLSTGDRPAAEQNGVAIAGGVVTAGLGLASLFVHAETTFDHARNLLADVWRGPPVSTTYPPVIWGYLTRPQFSNSGRRSIRESIVGRWTRFRQIDDPKAVAILFGSGGSYDADTLRLRAAMLDEVKAEVELFHQDLATLAIALPP